MTRTPTGETPFRLTYGSKAVIPAEVGLTSYRVGNHDKTRNDEAMRLQLDLVEGQSNGWKKFSTIPEPHGQTLQLQSQMQGLLSWRSCLKKGDGLNKRHLPGEAMT